MIRRYRWEAILSSAVILVPMLAGLVLWDRLPGNMVVHWGADGHGDGLGPRAVAVFGIPLATLAIHWVCLLFTAADGKNRGQSQKAMGLIFWMLPIVSLLVSALLYSTALGRDMGMALIFPAMMGVMFIVFGNYFPKIRQNRTIGIKVPWTLANEENWNKTHRMGGKLWVAGGFGLLVSLLLPEAVFVVVLVADMLVLAVVPILYSYALYRRQLNSGACVPVPTKSHKKAALVGAAASMVVLAGCGVLLFTGDIVVHFEGETFTIEASYYTDLTVDCRDIDSVELREPDDPGIRTNGFGSPRLSMGTFQNQEFGSYTRYTYTGGDTCIVLRDGDHVLVLGGEDEAATRAIYQRLEALCRG